MNRIFILQNAQVGSDKALSIFLTDFLRCLGREHEFNVISSKIKKEQGLKLSSVFETETELYSMQGNIKFTMKALRILIKESKKKRIDILHCFYPNSSLLAAVLFKLLHPKTRIIYDVRSPWIDMTYSQRHMKKNPVVKLALETEEWLLSKFVDSFVFISDGLSRYYQKKHRIPGTSLRFVIPTGIDTNRFKNSKPSKRLLGMNPEHIIIGQVGGLDINRDLEDFLELFSRTIETKRNLRLVFIGEGNAKEFLQDYAKKKGLQGYVVFKDSISHDLIPGLISSFDYGLCHLPDIPVYRNSVPIKILEYIASGIPVLASDIKAHHELKKKFPGIINIYTDKLHLHTTDEKEFRRINQFDWSTLRKKYMGVYCETLQQ